MKKVINVGIIGVGVVGERLIKALSKHDRANISGIYDTNSERVDYISKEYNLSPVDNYKELINNDDIDLIYLAVPPKYHHPIAMDIIAGKKHFICEKPLANSTDEAREMYEKAEENNIVHAMNFPTVYTPALKKLKSLLDENYIGDLRRIELHGYFKEWPRFWQQNNWISSREQGGFVREVFTHFVQLIQMFFGNMENVDTNIEYPKDPSLSETGIIARASLPSGEPVLFNGLAQIGMEDHLALTIYGTKGTLSLENWRELWATSIGEERKQLDLPGNDHLVELVDEVFKAIDGENSNIITFKEGYHAQRIIEKLLGRDS